MRVTEAGYNMLELIMAIAIMGVLAAVAAPKFMNANTAARATTVTSLRWTLDTTNKFIYVKAASAGVIEKAGNADCKSGADVPPAAGPYVNFGDGTNSSYVCTAFGFARDATELARRIDLEDIVVNGNSFRHSKAADKTSCEVIYTPAASSATPPTHAVDIADCS